MPAARSPQALLVLGVSPRLDLDDDYRSYFDLAASRVSQMLSAAAEHRDARTQPTADERNNEFLAMLAHELRNPLAPIRSAAELLKYVDRKPGSLPHARQIIERQLTQLVRLMDDLLDASRISRGKLELRKQPFDVRAAAASAVESATPAMQEAGHELTVGLSDEPLAVSGDRARLIQVIGNLLTNAAQYTPRGGHIRLSIGRDGDNAVVSVTDDGMGIKEDMLSRIFEMFTQVAPRDDGPRKGLGIGLTIARRLVEMHGGSLTARSAGLGNGSEFIATLPLLETPNTVSTADVLQESNPGDVHRRNRSAAGGLGKRKILVADDNTDAASAIAEILRTMGHEVRTADDGLAAVEAAGSFRPDMILLDLGMPRLDGYDACRQIRGMPWGREISSYAFTGWGQASDRRRTREAGFNAHLVKPVEIGAIEKLIERSAKP
jgi:signal transduction histidine kinase